MNILYYVAACVVMLTMSVPVKAQDLKQLLEGKTVIYAGTCWFKTDGVITFKRAEMKETVPCVVGMEMPDETRHYILVLNKKGDMLRLVLYDEKTKEQKTLWADHNV